MAGNIPLTPLLRNHVKGLQICNRFESILHSFFVDHRWTRHPIFQSFFLRSASYWVQIRFPYWKTNVQLTLIWRSDEWLVLSNKGPLLDRDGFGQIPWTINVASSEHCQVVWQKLHGDHSQDGLHGINSLGHLRQIRMNLLWIQISNVGQRTHSLVG